MRIKLLKSAQWGGKTARQGSTHDVDDAMANKLIERGYAEICTPEPEVEHAAPSE